MQSSFGSRIGSIVFALALLAGAFFVGIGVGKEHSRSTSIPVSSVMGTDGTQSVNLSAFWRAWNILDEKYVPTQSTTTVSAEDKVWGAIKGLAESYGDPYTTFFPPVDNQAFQEEISGNFEGVGMELATEDGILTVIAPLKNSPAERSGVKAGDKILKIDETITANLPTHEAIKLIRGKKGTSVRLTLLSESDQQPREISVIRDVINIPTIDTEITKDGVFVIHLYSFTANSASLFRNALQEFIRSKSDKLVLDLRGNPGGYLEAAVDMASWFLPSDKTVVQEDSGGRGNDHTFKSKGYNIFNENLKMVILVDGGSASASEILAGALQQNGVAKVVGQKTFGKGSVQELVPLTSDTALKITVARWLTPNGMSISEQGLAPDLEVKVEPEDAAKKFDRQLEAAMNLVLGQ